MVEIPDEFSAVNFRSIKFSNNRFLVSGAVGSIMTSTDGKSWKKFKVPTKDVITAVVFGEGIYVATTSAGQVFTSNDGSGWVKRADLTFQAERIVYGAGYFVIAGTFEAVAASVDGLVWDVLRQDNLDAPFATMISLVWPLYSMSVACCSCVSICASSSFTALS